MCSRAGGDLRVDVGEHDVRLHDAELAVVDRHDRTVAAQVPAAAAGFRVADQPAACRRGICSVAYRDSGGSPVRSGTRKWSRGSDRTRRPQRLAVREQLGSVGCRCGSSVPVATLARDAARSASNSPPSTSSTPSERSHSAFSGAYSPYAQMRADGFSAARVAMTGAASRVAVCIGR